jgi:hypothetical protein
MANIEKEWAGAEIGAGFTRNLDIDVVAAAKEERGLTEYIEVDLEGTEAGGRTEIEAGFMANIDMDMVAPAEERIGGLENVGVELEGTVEGTEAGFIGNLDVGIVAATKEGIGLIENIEVELNGIGGGGIEVGAVKTGMVKQLASAKMNLYNLEQGDNTYISK